MGITSTKTFNIKGENIDFPAYQKGNKTIVSFSRLRKFYNNNKEKYGVNDHIKFCDSKIGPNGDVSHAFVCVNLVAENFNNDYIGEVTSLEYRDDVDRKFPISIAYNRALSSALLSYFGFPEKTYTTVQFLAEDEGDAAIQDVNEETVPETVNNETTPTIGEAEAIPYSTEPAETKGVTFPDPKEEVSVANEVPPVAEKNPVETTSTNDTESADEITMSSEVGFGKYSSLSIAEVIDKKKAGDDFAVTFINMIKSGKVIQKDERGKKVVEFIKKNA